MLPQEIHLFKEKLIEQAKLAEDQITLVGFYNSMYGFVEIIENDPIFSLFIRTKIKEEVEFYSSLIRKVKNKEISKQTWYELSQAYTRDKFYFGYYVEFKNVHDDFKLVKSKILETKSEEEEVFKLHSDPKYYNKLSEEEIKMYTGDFEKCIQKIVELINSDQKLLKQIYDEVNIKSKRIPDYTVDRDSFDRGNSILILDGQPVKISLKNDLPVDHFILEALFENEYWPNEIYFKDVAIDKLKYDEYDSNEDWHKFYRACKHLNDKIKKATDNGVLDFVLYSSGKKAWSKINPKYVKKPVKIE